MLQVKQLVQSIQFSEAYSYVKNSELVKVFVFSLLTAISAQISIPTQPVPFTLQTVVVLLAGAFLGPVNGAISQLLYIGVGSLSLPVFANFTGGFPVLFGPTGGYLLAFPIVAFFVGLLLSKTKNIFAISATMFLGTAMILFSGALYLSLFFNGNLTQAFTVGALGFSVWEVAKTIVAITIFYSYRSRKG